jgi:uncharacterized protein (DUF1501 family)
MNNSNSVSPASATIPANHDILVCIFQRGAADGLNSLVPYGDPDYATQRGSLAVPAPGNPGGALDLDGFFGLHPSLLSLQSIYQAGDLALVHATGVPHGSRSHFAAQGLVERGVDDQAGPNTGWLGRHLALTTAPTNSAFRVVSISGNVPVSLLGADDPLAISDLDNFGFDPGIIQSGYPTVLDSLYRSPVPFSGPAQAALDAIGELSAANLPAITPDNGAVYPTSPLGGRLRQAASLIKSALPVEVICIDADDWDHHESLPTFLPQSLADLADSVSAFYTDLAIQMQRITLLVNTEFGRRVAGNASNGTDHGTGGLAYLVGGGVNGGQVVSSWPGLATANLEMGEDLKITTDLRTVLAELLNRRLGGTDVNAVFPGFTGPVSANVFL